MGKFIDKILGYGKVIFTYGQYLSENARIFEELMRLGYSVKCVDEIPDSKYPHDIPLNCAIVGKNIIANRRYASASILSLAATEGLSILHTPQGYAKCSSAVIEKVLVTADRGICAAASAEGLETMRISSGHIGIEVYDTGFIGGASVTLNENTIGFFGSLASHPEGEEIRAFFEKNGIEVVELSDGALFDYGGAVRVVK